MEGCPEDSFPFCHVSMFLPSSPFSKSTTGCPEKGLLPLPLSHAPRSPAGPSQRHDTSARPQAPGQAPQPLHLLAPEQGQKGLPPGARQALSPDAHGTETTTAGGGQ